MGETLHFQTHSTRASPWLKPKKETAGIKATTATLPVAMLENRTLKPENITVPKISRYEGFNLRGRTMLIVHREKDHGLSL